jgi:hypothetical protein
MKSFTSRRFWEMHANLPDEKQLRAKRVYQLFRENPSLATTVAILANTLTPSREARLKGLPLGGLTTKQKRLWK